MTQIITQFRAAYRTKKPLSGLSLWMQSLQTWLEKSAQNNRLKIIERDADKGNPASQYEMARHILKTGTLDEVPQAHNLLMRSADSGHADAQYALGQLFETGHYAPRDYVVALRWYLKAAESGALAAQIRLGKIYERGQLNTYQDYALAHKWYVLAAVQDNAEAQTLLGNIYLGRAWKDRDPVLAAFWLDRAGENGNRNAEVVSETVFEGLDYKDQRVVEQMKARWEEIKTSRGQLIPLYRGLMGL